MGWSDRFSSWLDHQVERVPALDHWMESHFHAFGFHGPYIRHLAKTRLAPAILLGGTILLVLLVVALVRRSRARRRRQEAAAAAVLAGRLSAAGGPPPSR
ncbi:MAG TPA: hypothetical protein VOB72_23450 [Candidatus Dormibacteraeota bacterium]|nr:hypothetical protein [Candidatus Dormibacteraeota bacterium]